MSTSSLGVATLKAFFDPCDSHRWSLSAGLHDARKPQCRDRCFDILATAHLNRGWHSEPVFLGVSSQGWLAHEHLDHVMTGQSDETPVCKTCPIARDL